MPTTAVWGVTSRAWEKVPVEAKEHVFQICHPCVSARNALCRTEYHLKMSPLLRIAIMHTMAGRCMHSLPVPSAADDLLPESGANIIFARGYERQAVCVFPPSFFGLMHAVSWAGAPRGPGSPATPVHAHAPQMAACTCGYEVRSP
jgi:hypothetical protein